MCMCINRCGRDLFMKVSPLCINELCIVLSAAVESLAFTVSMNY